MREHALLAVWRGNEGDLQQINFSANDFANFSSFVRYYGQIMFGQFIPLPFQLQSSTIEGASEECFPYFILSQKIDFHFRLASPHKTKKREQGVKSVSKN